MCLPCSLLSASTLGLTSMVTPLRARPPVGLRCHIGHLAEAPLDPPRRTRCTCRVHCVVVVGVGNHPGCVTAGDAFPLLGVWPCPLLRRRESSLRVVVAGAHPMETAVPFPLGGGPEARPWPYLGPHRCALLLYHWGPRLPSVSLGGWRIFSSPPEPC